jgi:hypothetical protein
VYVTVALPFSSKHIAQSKTVLIFCGVSEYRHVRLEVGLLFCVSVHVKVTKFWLQDSVLACCIL